MRDAGIDAVDAALDLVLPSRVHFGIAARLTPLQKRTGKSQLLFVGQAQSLLSDLGQLRTHDVIVSTKRNSVEAAFFAANTLVG